MAKIDLKYLSIKFIEVWKVRIIWVYLLTYIFQSVWVY